MEMFLRISGENKVSRKNILVVGRHLLWSSWWMWRGWEVGAWRKCTDISLRTEDINLADSSSSRRPEETDCEKAVKYELSFGARRICTQKFDSRRI
jgi:hypothetical protein